MAQGVPRPESPGTTVAFRGAVERTEAVYRRRDPEQSVLYQVVREHLLGFFEYAESRSADGRGLPRYVRQEFLRYLKCGILANGFIRVRCPDCGHDAVVAFSCKNRGICPSCAGRRMADTAAHLVDRVFPRAPVRQWVLSVPREVRYLLARESRLITGVVGIFMEEVFRDLKRRARERFRGKFFPGAVTSVQRYGGSLNLNLHLHSLVLDGVFVEEAGAKRMRFRRLPEPTKDDLDGVLSRVRHRALEYLGKEGYAVGRGDGGEREDVPEEGILGAMQAASVLEWVGLSGEARRVRVEGKYPDGYRVGREEGPLTVSSGDGWNLEAGVRIRGGDREGLEKLCRYVLRPPFAEDRLERLADGRVRYEFRRPRADGGTHLVLEPHEFLEKLAALVPPPRSHLVRFHGVLGPHARRRSRVVPAGPPEGSEGCIHRRREGEPEEGAVPRPGRRGRRRQTRWADLLRRTFGLDVLACPECGGRMKVIAAIEEPGVIRKILRAMGLPEEAPRPSPARPPPQLELGFEFDQRGMQETA